MSTLPEGFLNNVKDQLLLLGEAEAEKNAQRRKDMQEAVNTGNFVVISNYQEENDPVQMWTERYLSDVGALVRELEHQQTLIQAMEKQLGIP